MSSGAYGEAKFEWDDGIVRLHVVGPWNRELVLECHAALGALLAERAVTRWAMLVIVTGSTIFGPEVMEAIRDSARDEVSKKGRCATAWVIGSTVSGAPLFRGVIQSAVYDPTHEVRVFQTVEPAEAWLREMLKRGVARSPA